MNTSKKEATVTTKFHIEVPTADHLSGPAVYKVWFGQSYFIWRGKFLLQSAQQLAESIERYMRQQKNEPTDQLFHVVNHIRKTRCLMAKIEVIDNDLIREGTSAAVDVYRLLKIEQRLLHEAHGDIKCLNNNEQAYVSKWMEKDAPTDVRRFLNNWNKK